MDWTAQHGAGEEDFIDRHGALFEDNKGAALANALFRAAADVSTRWEAPARSPAKCHSMGFA